jgi:hypothetical protein
VALGKIGILHSWKWELEIVSKNLVSDSAATKDYDALAEVTIYGQTRRLGIEFERTLKGAQRYIDVRRILSADSTVDRLLYLTPSTEILYVLAVELRDVGKQVGFALSRTFQSDLLDAQVLTNSRASDVIPFRDFLLR